MTMNNIENIIKAIDEEIGRLLKVRSELREIAAIPEGDMDNWKYRHVYPFSMRVDDMDISIRLRNAILAMDIHTVGEIVSFTRKCFERQRNLGRKSLNELDVWLSLRRLDFGMWVDPDRDYADFKQYIHA